MQTTGPGESTTLFAGRYRLSSLLGRGSHGEVWEAEDTIAGGLCALKLIDASSVEPARIRREIAALRLLRLPGVVRLVDEGTAGERAFLAMERIHGAPFPGLAIPCSWSELAPRALALLEILARVHAAGVVHRDLKPSNVLVSADGRPTVLDFGISAGAALGQTLTLAGQILGTPAYLAPEQIRGDPIGPQTDLYAVGVMLYQALSGRLPHEANSIQAILRARLTRPPSSLKDIAPGVPAAVAALIHALLADESDERPNSAAETIALLSGRTSTELQGPKLPRLGDHDPVVDLIRALRSHQSIDIAGPRGSGRTRCLQEAFEVLQNEGRKIIRLVPGAFAFDSLEPVVGTLDERPNDRLTTIIADIDDALARALSSGAIVIADDAEKLDRWSAQALERARPLGSVVRAWLSENRPHGDDCIEITYLSESELRALFSGPDRLFHLPSDTARALFARTEGIQSAVDEELRAWIRAGLARLDGERISVDRDALDRLESGLRIELGRARGQGTSPAKAHLADKLRWIAFAAPNATAELLASAMKQPRWRAEEAIHDLAHFGFVELLSDGRAVPRRAVEIDWSLDQRRDAHQKLAELLPPGTEGRLLHLIAGEASSSEVAREALHLAERHAREGSLGKAVTILSEGLMAARRSTAPEGNNAEELKLLSLWTEIAIEESSAPALDKVLYEISRSTCPSPALERLEKLVRAALAVLTSAGDRALSIIDAVAPFDDMALECQRHEIRVLAARRTPLVQEERIVSESVDWANASGDARAKASMAGWLGRLRYRQDRFEEAAALHAQAAELEPWITARIAAHLNSASALMEAFRLKDARERAASARELAEGHRNVRYEARAEWLLRAIAYRMESPLVPDLELCDLAGKAGVIELEAFVCLNEAAVAFRNDDRALAMELASRAEDVWNTLGKRAVAMLARALSIGSDRPATAEQIEDLVAHAEQSPLPTLGLQILALLSMLEPSPLRRRCDARRALAMAASVPERFHGVRMEILSVNECLGALLRGAS